MRKARESSMALVVWRLVLALVLSFCAVAVIAPRQAPAADVIVFLEADAAAGQGRDYSHPQPIDRRREPPSAMS
jgi:hypothetical protein